MTRPTGRPWPSTGDEQLASALAQFGDGKISLPHVPPAVADRLRPHLKIMGAVVYLREVGSSDELGTKIERLLDAATAALAPPYREATASRWEKRHEDLEEPIDGELSEWVHAGFDAHIAHHHAAPTLRVFIDSVNEITGNLERQRKQAESYHRRLEEAGFAFDEATGHVREIPGARGGRPANAFPDIAEAVYNGLVAEGTPPTINGDMRNAIARILGGFFPPEWLDTTPGGYLDQSLRNANRPDRGGVAR